ncbi:MAG: serine hydrolase [Pseudomonadota bacterium]
MIIESLQKLEMIQGLSVAVYTPSGVYARGFGVTDIETGELSTADTAFYIASSTKSMVALALATLHERGEIDLDMTLEKFAPDAPFPEGVNPDQVSLRQLLSQSSGLLNEPIEHRLAYSGQHNSDLLWDLLSVTQPNTDNPVGSFEYTNSNYNILTLLLEKRFHRSWKEIVADEIFIKAGMTRTTAEISKAVEENWSLARPHATLGPNTPKRTYLQKTNATMHSAGGVVMSAKDAVKWLEILVENGKIEGRQVVPENAVKASRNPQVSVGKSFGPYKRDHYALGWYTGGYGAQEHRLVHHFGSFSGSRAHVSYMPEEKIGVAVFVNDGEVGFRYVDILANYIYDKLTANPDAQMRYEKSAEKLASQVAIQEARIAKQTNDMAQRKWALSNDFSHYAGTYENTEYGSFIVSVNGENISFTMGNLHATASATDKPESVRVELVPGSGEIIDFNLDAEDVVESLTYSGTIFKKL